MPDIIVGTPGRLIDIISISKQLSENLQYLIIDEADEMFSKGFKTQIYEIFKLLPKNCKIALFSANFSKDILRIIALFIKKPVKILNKKKIVHVVRMSGFFSVFIKNPRSSRARTSSQEINSLIKTILCFFFFFFYLSF